MGHLFDRQKGQNRQMHWLKTDIHPYSDGEKITWAGIGANIILLATKILGGIFGRSRALLADGIHSASDLLSDVLVLVGLHFFYKKEDRDHPYGHGKIETLSTMGVGLLLTVVAVGVGIHAIRGIINADSLVSPDKFTILIAAASIIFKESLYHFTRRIGERTGSDAVVANAFHHRSDAWTSGATLLGISLSVYVPSLRVLDPCVALFVALFILKTAMDIIKGSARKIIDTSPPEEFIREIREEAASTPGVLACHDLTGRYYADKIRMEIHIEVDPEMTVREAHHISDLVTERIKKKYSKVISILVHIDPYNPQKKGKREEGRVF